MDTQSQTVEGQVQEPVQQTGQAVVPLEEVAKLIETKLEEALRRQRQSLKATITDRVQKELERLRSAGIQATPEQVAQLVESAPQSGESRTQTVQEAGRTEQQNVQIAANSELERKALELAGKDGADVSNPVIYEIYKLQAKEGITLEDGDPELEELKTGDTLYETLASVKSALDKKRARLEKLQSPARVPALAGGNSSVGVSVEEILKTPGRDIIEQYLKKKG